METPFFKATFSNGQNKFLVTGNSVTQLYKITLLEKGEEIKTNQKNDTITGFLIDLSGSMDNTHLSIPFLNALKKGLEQKFQEGLESAILCFWGKTAHVFEVTEKDYVAQIDHVYSKKGSLFSQEDTLPNVAFDNFITYIKKHKGKYGNLELVFATDGAFANKINYDVFWKGLAQQCLLSNSTSTISTMSLTAIGVVNDSLKNIKAMDNAFKGQEHVEFTYHTIQNANKPEEFISVMLSVVDTMQTSETTKVVLGDHTFILGIPVYLQQVDLHILFSGFEMTPIQIPEVEQGVSIEWKALAITLEIEIALVIQEATRKISQPNINHKTLLSQLLDQSSKLTLNYKSLIQSYKSLQSRKIVEASSLSKMVAELYDLIRQVQMLSNVISEKEAFAIKTQLTRNARHNNSLFRRLMKNKEKFEHEEVPIVTLLDNGKQIQVIKNKENKTYDMVVPIDTLTSTFRCYFTLADWQDIVADGTVLGIPVCYNWKDNDDWAPSKAYLEIPASGFFISLQGLEHAQLDQIGRNPLHEDLYNAKNPFLKLFGDTKCNSMVPVATDPTFLDKFPCARNYLSGIITGSEYGFRNQHVLYYVAVFKQLMNQLLENTNSEHIQHLIQLTINTFRVLFHKYNLVFEKDEKAVPRDRLLYYIAVGDTNRHYFASGWDSALMALVSSEKSYQSALEIYQVEQKVKITMNDFKILIWQMVFRNLWLHYLNTETGEKSIKTWTSPFSWGIPDELIVAQAIQEQGDAALKNYILTVEKISQEPVPVVIQGIIQEWQKSHKLVQLFLNMLLFADMSTDTHWSKFARSFLHVTLPKDGLLTTHFQNPQVLQDILLWSSWERIIYGEKDCYPFRIPEIIKPHIVNRVNAYFSGELRHVIQNIQEFEAFQKRRHETRYLPITFTPLMEKEINAVFADTYKGLNDLQTFKGRIRDILGHRYCMQIDDALIKDQLDVLQILFAYCQKNCHKILIKTDTNYTHFGDLEPSYLPYSCPSNACSPYFLQFLSDAQFRSYYAPIGMGNKNKKFRDWVDDLHNHMTSLLTRVKSADEFVSETIAHAKTFKSSSEKDWQNYEEEARDFYNKFSKKI